MIAVALAVGVAVYAWRVNQPNLYQAQAQLSVTPGQLNSGLGAAESDTVFLADTYAELAQTVPVVVTAVHNAKLHLDEGTASKRLAIVASSTIGFISVTATGPSPGAAAALARGETDALTAAVTAQQETALATQLDKINTEVININGQISALPPASTQLPLLQAQLLALEQVAANRQSQPLDELAVVAPARSSPSPISPRPARDALFGLLTALVVASELVALLEALGDRFPTDRLEEEVIRATELAVLARLPDGDGPGVVEASRKLRTSLLFTSDAARVRSVAIVSSEPGAGKSFISINLAVAVAELGVSTVLIDGDMRRPVIHQRLGIPRTPGLSEVLGGVDPTQGLHPLEARPNLLVMPAGVEVEDPSGALAQGLGGRVVTPLATALPRSDEVVVVDTPPEGLFPDAVTIAALCDATIVVVDARGTRRRSLGRTLAQLHQVGAKPIGIVINRARRDGSRGYYYGAHVPGPFRSRCRSLR